MNKVRQTMTTPYAMLFGLQRRHYPVLGAALAIIAAIFAIDWWLPLGLTITTLYVAPVLITSRIPHPRLTFWVAALASSVTVLDIFRGPIATITWVVVTNRAFALMVIWVTTLLCLRRQRDEAELMRINEDIEQQVQERTADLAKANQELEELRAEALSELAAIVKSSDDAIVGMSLNGIIQSWNAGAERVYGYPPEEVIGRSISVLCPPNRLDEVPAMLDRIARGEHVRNVETVQRRKKGERIDVSLTISPVKDGDGTVMGASAIARDVTEKKRTEAALRQSEARFRMMADTAPVMVWMAGPDTHITFVNKRWLEFTGRTLQEEIGDNWFTGIHPTDLERCRESYLDAFKSEQPFSLEYRLRRHDGEYRWIIDTGVPLFDANGRFGGYIGSCIDLTERKEMEDQLRRTLKEKESLLREVHHRVKNNLQVISSLLNLQSASIKDPLVNQLFRECQVRITSIALLHETLHRSSDLSRIKMGDYIRTLTGHLFRSYGVDPNVIVLELNVDDVEFDIDTGLTCGLIIDELVSNCLKHAFIDDNGGKVHIELQDHLDGTFSLCVSDDGIGIPKDGVLNNPDSLGLELVTLLAEKLDGTTELCSGTGTEWKIRFQQLQYSERV
ncbi:MAG: PAS domain S-box protein [Nitrospiraceae bacterium]|nr:PAS domain S-box protein [Nitrospiraceae bacterium]